jgi:hypothetical protein
MAADHVLGGNVYWDFYVRLDIRFNCKAGLYYVDKEAEKKEIPQICNQADTLCRLQVAI